MSIASPTCPRCQRTTASPFPYTGVCLRCAGERVLSIDVGEPAAARPPDDFAEPRASGWGLLERIGSYEILEELGRGGMGCIYAARQAGLGRIVALKVLPTSGNLAGLDLRFLREAQTVARLHHPHIVSVYDSGRASGYVYFSMEYVPGGDLGRRLRQQPFQPREAAVLLEKIAGAVAVAHTEGVLHRDIKPSNILLDADEPKLADFGLAAHLEPGGDLTAVSGVLGTPHYIAPECLRHGSAALTVASDIYALGAVLYQCLTGRTPFAGASTLELATLVETAEPPAPHLLAPAVPPDLETICLTCLERDPSRRYPSAGALAADLHRFLAGQTILARPPSAWDRWTKFAARHRTAVVATAAASLVLVGGAVVSSFLALRATRAEHAAATEAAKAKALAEFLERDLLAQADPSLQPDRNVTLHTVVDRAASRIDARFPDQPLLQADLHAVVGEVYDTLGDYAPACRHLERTVALRRAQLGNQDPETLTAMMELSGLLFDAGKLDEAVALGTETYELRRRVLGATDRHTIESANFLANALRERGRLNDAATLAVETLAAARVGLDRSDPFYIGALGELGTIRYEQFKLTEAETLLREALERRRAVDGPDALVTYTAMNDLALTYRQEGKFDEAAKLLEPVVEKRRSRLGADHPHTLLAMNNLAYVYRARNQLDKAEQLQVAAVEGATRSLGRDHPRTVMWLNNLAETYRLENKVGPALATCVEALESSRKVNGPTSPATVSALARLATVHLMNGDPQRAEPFVREAIKAVEKPDQPVWRLPLLRCLLGEVLLRDHRAAEAEPLLASAHQALEAAEASLPPSYRGEVRHAAELLAAARAQVGR